MRTLKAVGVAAINMTPKLKTATIDDQRRGSTERSKLYSGRRWRKLRRAYLQAHPLCVECEHAGRVVAATVVDHRDGHAREGWLNHFWDEAGWQALCTDCHNAKSGRELADWNRSGGMVREGGKGCRREKGLPLAAALGPSRETKSVLPKSKTRGGARPGAGRKRKPKQVAPASPAEQTPVEYALAVMRDPEADVQRRDVMARALLTFMRAGKPAVPPSTTEDDDKWRGIL
jgi:5-methylcytosine-specific restriction protein A